METPQPTDLILLIGTNPLPNYVVASYFLKNTSKLNRIWLVYSEGTPRQQGTYELANNIKALLNKKYERIDWKLVPLSSVSQARSILQDFQKSCLKELRDSPSVHLNYTGGTKAMGIHVYRSLEHPDSMFTGDIPPIRTKSFSYLDVRTFKIIEDESGALTQDLRQHPEVSLSFEQMIGLHGFHRVNSQPSDAEDIEFSSVVSAFTRIIADGRLTEFFNKSQGGYDRKLFKHKKRPQDLALRPKDLCTKRLQQHTPNASFREVLDAFPIGYRLIKDGKLTTTEFDSNVCCKRAIKFLDGFWFEEYLSEIIKRRFSELEVKTNWEIAKNEWRTKFELDIMLVQGYQLIGVSCTTSGVKDLCKNKGFEILQRTRQIGGDEAKAVMITCLSEDGNGDNMAKIVEEELQFDTGNTGNILVLGVHDLAEETLVNKIQEFMI